MPPKVRKESEKQTEWFGKVAKELAGADSKRDAIRCAGFDNGLAENAVKLLSRFCYLL